MRKHIPTFLLAFLVYSGIAASAQDILWMSDYSVLTARFHPTEDYVYTSQEGLGIVKRDKFTGDSLELISDFPAKNIEFSKDGKMLAAGNTKGKLLVLDIETKEVLMEEQLEVTHSSGLLVINDIEFSNDSKYLAFACAYQGFRLYETQTFKLATDKLFPFKFEKWGWKNLDVLGISFNNNTKDIALSVGGYDDAPSTIYIYNTIAGTYKRLVESDYATFNPVNDELYVNNANGIWIYKSLDKEPELLECKIYRFGISEDGQYLLNWTGNNGLNVLNLSTKTEIMSYTQPHPTLPNVNMTYYSVHTDPNDRYFLLRNAKVAILDRGYPLTVNENIKVKKLEVYPNPTATNIDYSYSLEENAELSIYINDIEGKTVKSIFHEYQVSGEHNGSEDISDLAQGTYFLIIESAGAISSNKFVVVK